MATNKLSIRRQLLILAAVATASIWGGALLQFRHLQVEQQRLATVRAGLSVGVLFGDFATLLAVERGQTYGHLLAAREQPARVAVAAPRAAVDQGLSALKTRIDGAQLTQYRSDLTLARDLADAGTRNAGLVFTAYSSLIGKARDAAARYLAEGMIEVGLPYEHVTHLNETAEHLAQIRGMVNGVLASGVLTAEQRTALIEQITLYTEYEHLYSRAAPRTAKAGPPASAASSAEVVLAHTRRLIDSGSPEALGLSASAWWATATTAINVLLEVASGEARWLSSQAELRMHHIEQQIQFTVYALVVLGILTLVLTLSTVGRIVRGLNALLTGLEGVSSRGNFNTRIEVPRGDEFSNISAGVNKLIAMAASVVAAREKEGATDPLTGLLNRRGLHTQLAARLHPSRGQMLSHCLLAIDIDHFKRINDRYGHPLGDQVLIKLSAELLEQLRDDDLVCRSGGEEFLVLLAACDLHVAESIAENLRRHIAHTDFGLEQPVTISLGLAGVDAQEPIEQLMARADRALYLAKQQGRNRVVVAPFASEADSAPTNGGSPRPLAAI